MRKTIEANPACHDAIKALAKAMYEKQIGTDIIAAKVGIDRRSIQHYIHGTKPISLYNMEACLNAVGLTLTVSKFK